ncbi:MAG: adenylate/guanylate cyclase domain-containing protein [Cyclobacteriaceae bacterium]|jgi:TolB-like protein/class 3 adenylate cyclase/tetratricopeptide (TPR) repeat protein
MEYTPNNEVSSGRKLAAIMFTDIVGYTVMMQKDEEDGLRRVEHHRIILERYISLHNGKILQYYGDGTLSIFESAYDAVLCAIDIQKELSKEPTVPLRIGIHLGEVVVRQNAIFGDGVNVASRIQALSVSGGILISDSIFRQIRNQTEFKFKDLGEYKLKNVDLPVGIYAISNKGLPIPDKEYIDKKASSFQKISIIKKLPTFARWLVLMASIIIIGFSIYLLRQLFWEEVEFNPSPKSVAVLPFANLSQDPEQEYFSDGITEDILNHLSKISGLEVKSRTSTLQYKEKVVPIPEIGRELEVANILEGSVRKEGNKIRIVAQLIDTQNDIHIWSETYDREMTELFNIQSEIAIEIANVLQAKLSSSEMRYLESSQYSTSDVTAYDYALRARELRKNWNDVSDLENVLQLLEQSVELDPNFAYGYTMIGIVLHFDMRTVGVPTQIWIDEALHMAEISINLDSTLPEAYLLRSYAIKSKFGKSQAVYDDLWKAYELDPGNPTVMFVLGNNLIEDGKYDKGAEMVMKSINMSYTKKDTEYYVRWGNIYEKTGNYKKAEKLYLQCRNLAPGWSEAYTILGRLYLKWEKYEDALEMFREGLKIVPEDPVLIDQMAWAYFKMDILDSASYYWSQYEALERNFMDRTQYVPFRHRYAYTNLEMGNDENVQSLFEEQMQLDMEQQQGLRGYGAWRRGSHYYDLGAVNAFLGNTDEAIMWLDSAANYGFLDISFANDDPLLDDIRKDDRFQALIAKKEQEHMMIVNAFKEEMKNQKQNLPR